VKLHRFPKSERLRSKKLIDALFSPANNSVIGGNVFLYPFKIIWLKNIDSQFVTKKSQTENSVQITPLPNEQKQTTYPQILVSVSKRNFKKATDRNRIRRQVKEAYRQNKHLLFENKEFPPVLAIIYIAKEKSEYAFIEKKLVILLKKILNSMTIDIK
jgi:ribonuclease P protein component